jgi:hypothetical protein
MNSIKQWLSNHSISAKTVASAWAFVTALWYISPPFHDYVKSAYDGLPKGIHGFVAGVAVPALIFWRTQKKTTVTAEVSPGETGTASASVSTKP